VTEIVVETNFNELRLPDVPEQSVKNSQFQPVLVRTLTSCSLSTIQGDTKKRSSLKLE